jgi:hypothetical protein
MRDSESVVERDVIGRVWRALGAVVGVGFAAGWSFELSRVLRHRLFVSNDTAINYAHVWFISDRLWHRHSLPLHMSVLGHGSAFTFPYGFVPWLTAGIVRPLFGDWTVTLWLVLGVVGLIVGPFVAFPELRRGWWPAAVLANPALMAAAFIGQVPFSWAASLLLFAIAFWRRGRRGWAVVFAAAAQVTHPAIVAPLAFVVVALWLRWEPDRRALVRSYILSVVPALPAAWLVYKSPVFTETSTAVKVANFLGTLAPRSLAVLVPMGLAWLAGLAARRSWPRLRLDVAAAVSTALLCAATAVLWQPLGMPYAWGALRREPDRRMVDFVRSPLFVPGAEYRVLRAADGKVGMYQLLRGGGRLDSEFFPESILRVSWPDPAAYSAFLRRRHVDYVFVWRGYTSYYQVNEESVLGRMAAASPAQCHGPVVCVQRVAGTRDYQLFKITRS